MRHLLILIVAAFFVPSAPAQPDLPASLLSHAKDLEARGLSGAFLAAKDGQVIAAAGIGHADLQNTIPNTPETLFEIASLTKQFTAAAILLLAQDHKLALSDPISKHLPGIPESCQAITVEHLLRHTSGIPGSNAQGGGDDLAAVLPTFLAGGPRHTPGEHFEYWNQGYALLSEIIARASGQPYTEYCRERLFKPAGLASTFFTGDPAPPGLTVAVGRTSRGKPRSALDHPYGGYGFQYRGMGGIVTTVRDLYLWDRALKGDTLLNADSKTKLFTPGPGDYGLGWRITRDSRGRLIQSHGGGVRGFICELRRYPESDALLIVLCNNDAAPLRQAAQGLETILFGGQPSGGPPLRGLDPALIPHLTGVYKDDKGRTLTITLDGPVTRAALLWGQGGPTTHATIRRDESDAIIFDDGSERIPLTLTRPEGQSVQSLTILNMTFHRADP